MPEPVLAAIALGSNLSDRARNLGLALEHLGGLGTVADVSSFHDTPPELFLAQPRFLNAAALLSTSLSAAVLLEELLAIELKMGRVRVGVPAKGPRLIDLDLVLFGGEVSVSERLVLPHPALHERRFVLAPLAEIAPDWRHPVLGSTVAEMLRRLDDGPAGSRPV